MDSSLPVVPDDGDLSWSDSHSMDSDDSHGHMMPQSPPWLGGIIIGSAAGLVEPLSASNDARLPFNGQLSPISTGMDVPPGPPTDSSACTSASDSAVPAMLDSASSSTADSWSLDYVDADGCSNGSGGAGLDDIHWEEGSDDILQIPKLEPLDEDELRLEDVKEAPMTPVPGSSVPAPGLPKVKRPRGRPRKHPLTPIVTSNKVTKGRSKTGCITCRKRKKKCDEAKPRCMNCEKNAVVCEGYPEKQIWKSGKERAEEERMKCAHALPVITMQPIFSGLETLEDMVFWRHYNGHLSTVLTVEGEHKNAFKDMLIPIATKHQGLMHSILALSGKHLDFDTPYGMQILKSNPNTTAEALRQRSEYHHEKAMEKLYEDIARHSLNKDDLEYKTILCARYGQIMCLLLEALAEGNPRGEHRLHLQAYQTLIQHSPPEDPAFLAFVTEFFQYHIFADELIRYTDKARLASEDWTPDHPIHPPRLLGVADGLFRNLCKITSIRNTIRDNMARQIDPVVDYTSLYRAAEIDSAIRDWTPHWPPGDSRDRVSLLYKQMMWVYLYRTIYPPSLSALSTSLSPMGGSMGGSMGSLPGLSSSSAIASSMSSHATTPPSSATNSCTSSPSLRPHSAVERDVATSSSMNPATPRRHSFAAYQPSATHALSRPHNASFSHPTSYHLGPPRADSPPPIRQPAHYDPRIALAVDESLAVLESFKPSDPSQTLLLIPCLVIGTACFGPAQQERVRVALRAVQGYTGLRNTARVGELLEEVWRCMERGEWARVWDWQGVARSMGLDFLCR